MSAINENINKLIDTGFTADEIKSNMGIIVSQIRKEIKYSLAAKLKIDLFASEEAFA